MGRTNLIIDEQVVSPPPLRFLTAVAVTRHAKKLFLKRGLFPNLQESINLFDVTVCDFLLPYFPI
jgi:hypothetical protein